MYFSQGSFSRRMLLVSFIYDICTEDYVSSERSRKPDGWRSHHVLSYVFIYYWLIVLMSRGGRAPMKLRFYGRISGILIELSPTLVEVLRVHLPLSSTLFNTVLQNVSRSTNGILSCHR